MEDNTWHLIHNLAKDGKLIFKGSFYFGTIAGATIECAGAVAVSAKVVSAFAEAVCSFCWSCFCKTASTGATVGNFGYVSSFEKLYV